MISLFDNIYNGIKTSKKYKILLLLLSLIVIKICILTYTSYLELQIMNSINTNDKQLIFKLIFLISFLWMIKHIIFYYYTILYNKKIKIKLTKFYKEYFMNKLFLDSDIEWLNCQNTSEIYTAINSGTNALISTIEFLLRFINPLFQTLGNIIIIYNLIGIKICFLILLLAIIFVSGSLILKWEYHQRENINKKTNNIKSYNIHLADTIIVDLLNNTKKINAILNNSMENLTLNTNISIKTQNYYVILEIFGYFIIPFSVYFLAYNETVSNIVFINLKIGSMLDHMWWLFHMFNNASSNAAEWAVLEEYLKSFVPNHNNIKFDLTKYNITRKYILPKTNEYKIIGKSGSGKSSWMRKHVIDLYKYHKVCWIYMDQRMKILNSSKIKIYDFLTNENNIENEIYYWAKYLKLYKIINPNTIYKPFSSPSGGEEKRIIILKKILPILLNKIKVKIIFADEICAGLDHITATIIRNLIELLKKDYNIIFVNIDHHKYKSPDLIKFKVKKICDQEYLFNNQNKSNKNCFSFFDISKRYKKENNIKPTMAPLYGLDLV